MEIRLYILMILIGILIFYSREMRFMPNYVYRPDGWHLFVPMLFFYSLLAIAACLSVFLMIRKKALFKDVTVIMISSTLCFAMMKDPNGYSAEIGYIGMAIIASVLFVMYLKAGLTRGA